MNKQLFHSFLRLLFIIAVVVVGLYVAFYLSTLTYPFIIALVLSFVINPVVGFFERRTKMPRAAAVLVTLVLFFALFVGIITLLVAEILSGTHYLATVVPSHFEKLVIYIEDFVASQIIPLYDQLSSMFKSLDQGQQGTILENIQAVGSKIATSVGAFVQGTLQNIPTLIGWLPNAATLIVFSLLATFFISKDWERLRRMLITILPNKVRVSGKTIFVDLQKALFGFIKAQATLISITTVIVLIGLLILRVEYAITIALIIGIVDILPYLGTGLVFVPWIGYAFVSGDVRFSIGLGILYVIVLIQRQVMEPKILSSSIGLDPLATLIALFVGFKLIGFLGLIVGPVVLVIGKTLNEAGIFRDLWLYIKGKNA